MAALGRLCIVFIFIYLQVCEAEPLLGKFSYQQRPPASAPVQTTPPSQPQPYPFPRLRALLDAFKQKKMVDFQLLLAALSQTTANQGTAGSAGQPSPAISQLANAIQNLIPPLQTGTQGNPVLPPGQGQPVQGLPPGQGQPVQGLPPGQGQPVQGLPPGQGQPVQGLPTVQGQPYPVQPGGQQIGQTPGVPVQQNPGQQIPGQQNPVQQNPLQQNQGQQIPGQQTQTQVPQTQPQVPQTQTQVSQTQPPAPQPPAPQP